MRQNTERYIIWPFLLMLSLLSFESRSFSESDVRWTYLTEEERTAKWDRSTSGDAWEVSWTAVGSPADMPVPYQLWFDNPHDDDLADDPLTRASCRFRYNSPASGFMTVDRIQQADGSGCWQVPMSGTCPRMGGRMFTGNIWRRDEYISYEAGGTYEFSVILPNHRTQAQHDAFNFNVVGTDGAFSLLLSPGCVKIGQLRGLSESTRHSCTSTPSLNAKPFNNSDRMHLYRVVQKPNSLAVDVYIDGTLFISGTGDSLPFVRLQPVGSTIVPTGDTEYEFPYILLGDNTGSCYAEVLNNTDVSAAYTLGPVRYTRGAYPPGSAMALPSASSGAMRRRTPPAQPKNSPVSSLANQSLDFDELPILLTYPGTTRQQLELGYFDSSGAFVVSPPPAGNGVVHFKSTSQLIGGGPQFYFYNPASLYGNGAWTVETRLKVGPGATDRAFGLNVWDRIGSTTVLFSYGKVELQYGMKLVGISAPVPISTPNEFHTYRLMRPANSMYVYLFVDGNPIPAIADFKMSGVQMNGATAAKEMRIQMGFLNQIMPSSFVFVSNPWREQVYDVTLDAYVDYLRWEQTPASIQAKKNPFWRGEPLTVSFCNAPGNVGDWVSISKIGSADNSYEDWAYTNGTKAPGGSFYSGTISFGSLPVGTYEARLYRASPSYSILARSSPFNIADSVQTDKPVYARGEPMTVSFAWSPGNANDWIGISPAGSSDSTYAAWRYTNGTQVAGGSRVAGSVTLTDLLPGGTYESRLYLQGTVLSRSPRFTITPSIKTNKLAYQGTEEVTVSFLATGRSDDWIGISRVGSIDSSYVAWLYTNGTTSPGGSVTLGSVVFKNLPNGSYEARLYTKGYNIADRSLGFTISASVSTDKSSYLTSETVRVAFGGAYGYSNEWIGISTLGSPDASYVAWRWTNNTTTAGAPVVSGTVTIDKLPAGTYEARLYYGSTVTARSRSFTVK